MTGTFLEYLTVAGTCSECTTADCLCRYPPFGAAPFGMLGQSKVTPRIQLGKTFILTLIKALETVERISLPEAEDVFIDGTVDDECDLEYIAKVHFQICIKPQKNLSRHRARKCMKECARATREAEVQRAEESYDSWVMNGRVFDFMTLPSDDPTAITHLVNWLLEKGIFVKNLPPDFPCPAAAAHQAVASVAPIPDRSAEQSSSSNGLVAAREDHTRQNSGCHPTHYLWLGDVWDYTHSFLSSDAASNEVLFKMTKTQIFLLMKVLALAESLKGPFPYSADFHNCAYLNHGGSKMLQLPSLKEKIKMDGGWDGAFDSFTVHEGCMLTIWPGQGNSLNYQSGTFQIISNVTAFLCSCEETPYEKFVRQHIDDSNVNVDNNYCNTMMKEINTETCKPVNTFIHANVKAVEDVCLIKPIHDNIHQSNDKFNVTTCRNKNNTPNPPCYYTPENTELKIKIACENNKPVHYERPNLVS
ncbi:ANG4 protein, partial [Polypterus senegalus]